MGGEGKSNLVSVTINFFSIFSIPDFSFLQLHIVKEKEKNKYIHTYDRSISLSLACS